MKRAWLQSCHLLLADARQVPHHETAVSAAGRQDGLIFGAPPDLEHLLIVVLKCVKRPPQVAQIVQRDLHPHVGMPESAYFCT